MQEIKNFIQSNSRNHLLFTCGKLDGVQYVDVGLALATQIEDILHHRKLSMKAQDYVNDIFKSNTKHSADFGEFLAIENIGILFEPLLQIDIFALLNRWSQNQLLIVEQKGHLIENNIFYLTPGRESNYSINLQSINHKTIANNI